MAFTTPDSSVVEYFNVSPSGLPTYTAGGILMSGSIDQSPGKISILKGIGGVQAKRHGMVEYGFSTHFVVTDDTIPLIEWGLCTNKILGSFQYEAGSTQYGVKCSDAYIEKFSLDFQKADSELTYACSGKSLQGTNTLTAVAQISATSSPYSGYMAQVLVDSIDIGIESLKWECTTPVTLYSSASVKSAGSVRNWNFFVNSPQEHTFTLASFAPLLPNSVYGPDLDAPDENISLSLIVKNPGSTKTLTITANNLVLDQGSFTQKMITSGAVVWENKLITTDGDVTVTFA